ncbi:MAG: ABC transporter permease [Saprospiraceae bacterium]|nr:ABC transporter permease [Saprospiraceae bacterium]
MWVNYLKAAMRNLAKQKLLTLINISGLSIGLACSALFILYALNEFNYDRFHPDVNRIFEVYRNTGKIDDPDRSMDTYLPMPLGPAMKTDLVDVEEMVRMRGAWGDEFIRVDGKVGKMPLNFADPSFFRVFNFPILYGNQQHPLQDHNDLVLTRTTAVRLFGQENAVGRTVEIRNGEEYVPFKVTAIFADIPAQSSIQLDALANYELLSETAAGERYQNHWNRSSFQTFVKLVPGSNLAQDQPRLDAFRQKYYPGEEAERRSRGLWDREGIPVTYGLMPMAQIHTNPEFFNGFASPANPETIWLLIAISLGVLIVACINFTTLAIGRSSGRAREVGIRKIIGSKKRHLMFQFIGESVLLSLASALIAILLVNYLLPAFNELANTNIDFNFNRQLLFFLVIGGLTFITGVLAGIYPAMVLSSFEPLKIVQGKLRFSSGNTFTRSLVVFQFVLSTALICATLIILKQLNYLKSSYPGFNKENVVIVNADGVDTRTIGPRFKQNVLAIKGIEGVSGSELSLGEGTGWSRSGWNDGTEERSAYEYFVDPDFLKVMGIELVTGRNFNPEIAADTINSVVVNEAFLRAFNWTPEEAIGKELKGYYESAERVLPRVIGVVKDFHYRPMSEEVSPQLFHQFPDYLPHKYFIRLPSGDPAPYLTAIGKAWDEVANNIPYNYAFLDENLDRFYQSEARWSKIIGWAGGISIFIACLGLFGLSLLSSMSRRKELGVRKVLGADVFALIYVQIRNYFVLVALGILIAVPITWYIMHGWLQHFANRIQVGPGIFFIGAAGSLLLAFVTVLFNSLKEATHSPIEAIQNQ